MVEDGQVTKLLSGTPQGDVISPLLSNIYLAVLDKLWERRHAHLGELVTQVDEYVRSRLRRFMLRRKGRSLRPGEAERWTHHEHGLRRLRGTVKYPEAA